MILDNGKEIYATFIETATILSLLELTKTYDIKLGLYYKDEWYVEEISERVSKEIHHTKATPIYRNTNEIISDWQERNIEAHKIMLLGTLETIDSHTSSCI